MNLNYRKFMISLFILEIQYYIQKKDLLILTIVVWEGLIRNIF